MSDAKKNAAFLNGIDPKSKSEILENIANHYGITVQQVHDEVTEEGAEWLLEYVTINRAAVHLLWKAFNGNV